MFENIGFGELFLIVLVILVFFGPKKIPEFARSLGKGIVEFKKAMRDVQSDLTKPDSPSQGPTHSSSSTKKE